MSEQKSQQNSGQHYVVGYGSLMSHDSRLRFSQIDADGLPVHVSGWQRAWNMNCPDNLYTCVGAVPGDDTHSLNGMLVPVAEITPQLRQREQSYHFVRLTGDAIQHHDNDDSVKLQSLMEDAVVWICQVTEPGCAQASYPIYQTYVDTCLSGCLEHVDEEFAALFVTQTQGWQGVWINDRQAPRYPRLADLNTDMHHRIDALLHETGVLQYRQESE